MRESDMVTNPYAPPLKVGISAQEWRERQLQRKGRFTSLSDAGDALEEKRAVLTVEQIRARVREIFSNEGWATVRVSALQRWLGLGEVELLAALRGGGRYVVTEKASVLWLTDSAKGRKPRSESDLKSADRGEAA